MTTDQHNTHVCPWWLAYTFENPLRRILHNPQKMLSEYVRPGQTVVDIGCGMGYFSLGLAKLVGPSGRVISVDLQQEMLDTALKRASKKGLAQRITPHKCEPDKIGLEEKVDFILLFWMVHEVPNLDSFFSELKSMMKPGAKILMAEPKFHVSKNQVMKAIESAEKSGLKEVPVKNVSVSHTCLFEA